MMVPSCAVALIEQFEGFSARPYLCPAGVWTIGFGSTRDARGNPVSKLTPEVNQDEARELVRRDLTAAANEVARAVKVALNDNQKGALLSFIFNVGSGNFRASTLLRKLNAGDYTGAADELPKWNRGGGVVLAGLVRRRKAERELFTTTMSA